MGKKYKRLYSNICDINNLEKSYLRAQQGKRYSNGFLVFKENEQSNLLNINNELVNETWNPDSYRRFIVYEPKLRLIEAPSFSDRIVHHSLCSVIEPIMDSIFLPWSFACRNGKGTHAGVFFVQSQIRKHKYTHFLKTDFKSFFASIDTDILHNEYERKISCQSTLRLIRKIIPPASKGVPIGALTSQLSANVYGNIFDQYLHHELKVSFARYMDDVIVFGYNSNHLQKIKCEIEIFSQEIMKLNLSRWSIAPVTRGINFLGYRIWPDHKLLRKSSVIRAKKKIRIMKEKKDYESLTRFLGSWNGHINKADTYNLKIWLDKEYDIIKILEFEKTKGPMNNNQLFQSIFD